MAASLPEGITVDKGGTMWGASIGAESHAVRHDAVPVVLDRDLARTYANHGFATRRAPPWRFGWR